DCRGPSSATATTRPRSAWPSRARTSPSRPSSAGSSTSPCPSRTSPSSSRSRRWPAAGGIWTTTSCSASRRKRPGSRSARRESTPSGRPASSRPTPTPDAVTGALDALVDLLDLEPIEVNIFRGVSPDEERQRVFGGQVAGQALVAAGRTVDTGFRVHSLHAYFLRPGDPSIPILYEVDRIRDGRSFTTRRVVAIQHGRAIFNLSASF